MPASRPLAIASILIAALVAGGCASQTVPTEDRWEGFNRGVYAFNSGVDKVFLRPVAKGYRFITPDPLERGFSNLFSNLAYPRVIVSNALQGKGKAALSDTGRFLLNSTIGIAGLFDVATPIGLEANNEDIGQALATWGVGSGPYVVLPFLGPSTLRDAVSLVGDQALHVRNHLDDSSIQDKALALEIISTRAGLLALDGQINQSADPYVFVREAYLQRRNYLIHDGEPPAQDDYGIDEGFDEDLDELDALDELDDSGQEPR